jgi:WD40 repeat protein
MWAVGAGIVILLVVIALASGIFSPPPTPAPTQVAAASTEIVTEEATEAETEAATETDEATPTPTGAETEEAVAEDTQEAGTAPTATPTSINEQSMRLIAENQAMMSVAFSNDGRWLVSGGGDNTLRVWDVATGEELINIPLGEEEFVITMAFSPDGRFFAAGGLDLRLSAADTLTDGSASPINVLSGGVVRGVAFSPNSEYLIYGGDNQVLEVYRVNNGTDAQLMHQLEGHSNGITDVAFSPDGELMATSGAYEDGQIYLWELSTHASTVWDSRAEFVDSIDFSPDGLRLAASTGGLLQIWNVVTGTELLTVNAGAYAATYSPDGRLIATAYDGGMISLVNTQTYEEVAQLSGHTITARALAFSPDGTLLASAAEDGIRLWSVSEYVENIPLPEPLPTAEATSTVIDIHATMLDIERNPLGVDFNPNGTRIVFGASDGAVRLWTPSIGELLTLNAGDEMVSNAVFSANGVLMASAGTNAVRIWDLRTNRQVFVVENEDVRMLAFSVNNQTFAFSDANNMVYVWSLLTNAPLYTFADATAEIGGLTFSPNGTQLAVSGGYQDGQIRVYNMSSGVIASTIDTGSSAAYGVTYSSDGALLAYGDGSNMVVVLDTATNEPITTLTNPAYAWMFSPNNTQIAAGGEDGNIYIYDARTGELVNTLTGHTAVIESLSYSPDGTRLVSTSEDGTVRIWDLTGDE